MASIKAKSDRIIHGALPLLIVMILLMVGVCIYFLYLHYLPIKRLRDQLALPAGSLAGNEYEELAAALTDARTGRSQIQALWDNQTEQLRQEFIASCLDGNAVYEEKNLLQVLNRLDIAFVGDYFCVVILEAEGIDGNAPTVQGLWEQALRRPALREAGCLAYYLLPHDGHQCVIVNTEGEEESRRVLALLQSALVELAQSNGFVLTVTASAPWQSFTNIHLAYLEANEARSYHSGQAAAKTASASAAAPYLPREQEELLLRYITAGNVEKAAATFSLIYKHNWRERTLAPELLRCFVYELLSEILRALAQNEAIWADQQEFFRQALHRARQLNDREELARLVDEAVRHSAEACAGGLQAVTAANDRPMMERIMACVNEHYRDLDFNVSRCADYLGISVPYLSNTFKQQTGIGLLNYISGLRIKYAKQCILERHISVAQAARAAGFENINTFIRIFKKYEGTTPGSIQPPNKL